MRVDVQRCYADGQRNRERFTMPAWRVFLQVPGQFCQLMMCKVQRGIGGDEDELVAPPVGRPGHSCV